MGRLLPVSHEKILKKLEFVINIWPCFYGFILGNNLQSIDGDTLVLQVRCIGLNAGGGEGTLYIRYFAGIELWSKRQHE